MRRNQLFLVMGLAFFFALGLAMFIVMPVQNSASRVVMEAVQIVEGPAAEVVMPPPAMIETVVTQPALSPLVVMMLVVLVALAAVGAYSLVRGTTTYRKRKHEELALPDPYLAEMVAEGTFTLAEDGELPDWMEIDAEEEKAKRS